MFTIEVYSNQFKIAHRQIELEEQGFFRKTKSVPLYEKVIENVVWKVRIVRRVSAETLAGFNAGRVKFDYIPSSYEIGLARECLKVHKGELFIIGEAINENKETI